MEADEVVVSEGWAFPALARKFHYFKEGRSLCGKWFFLGDLITDTGTDSMRDCKPCQRKVKRTVRMMEDV